MPGPYQELDPGTTIDEASVLEDLVPNGVDMSEIRAAGRLQACDRVWGETEGG